ncbi:hypothetical protein EV13_0828 [Prochlorococcus sp. MIT 0702]|nr:hypothetical protein EV13_0828 [Prochlorococcus sp. MIT 0702]
MILKRTSHHSYQGHWPHKTTQSKGLKSIDSLLTQGLI